MLPLHIGTDHPLGVVVLLLGAFGPFLLAGAVVVIIRRRDAAAESSAEQAPADASKDGRGAR